MIIRKQNIKKDKKKFIRKQSMFKFSIASILVFLLAGCAGTITGPNKFHIINISPDGDAHPVKEGTYRYLTNEIDDLPVWNSTSAEYNNHISKVIAGIDAFQSTCTDCENSSEDKKKVLIFIHGGLNTFEYSIDRVDNQYDSIKQDNIYPVFINWRSGGATTYSDHLFRIRDGEDRSTFSKFTSPFYFGADVLGAIAAIPEAWVEQGALAIEDTFLRNYSELVNFTVPDFPAKQHYRPDDDEPTLDAVGSSVLWLVSSPIKLFTTPLAYSFGKSSWDIMNRRVKSMFYRPCEFYNGEIECEETVESTRLFSNDTTTFKSDNSGIPAPEQCVSHPYSPFCSGALSVFLKNMRTQLCDAIDVKEGQCTGMSKYEITLIGHSMGAIVANQILTNFSDLPFKNIVFMGAAATSRETANSLVPYMQKHDSTDFYNLSLHPLNEEREISGYGLLPSGSLLVWIDSMYGLPETEVDRTFGRWTNARNAAHLFPPEVANRMYFGVFGFKENQPQEHGDFSSMYNGENSFEYWDTNRWGKDTGKYSLIDEASISDEPL